MKLNVVKSQKNKKNPDESDFKPKIKVSKGKHSPAKRSSFSLPSTPGGIARDSKAKSGRFSKRKGKNVTESVTEHVEDEDEEEEEDVELEFLDEEGEEEEDLDFDDEGSDEDISDTPGSESLDVSVHGGLSIEKIDGFVERALTMNLSSLRKLLKLYSTVVNQSLMDDVKLDGDTKLRSRSLNKENHKILKGVGKKIEEWKERGDKRIVLIKDNEIYVYLVSKVMDVMAEYIKRNPSTGITREFKEDHSVSFDHSQLLMIRRFLSTTLIQLGFVFNNHEICRIILITLSSEPIMKWILLFRYINRQFVKIVCSLMTGHVQKTTRVNCYQFLSKYLNILKNNDINCQITKTSTSYLNNVTSVDRLMNLNDNVNFLIQRCYKCQIKAIYSGVTLKNYSLFKITQNCITEIFNSTPHQNLYTLAFKSIRDLNANIRREWIANNKTQKLEFKSNKNHNLNISVCSWGFIEATNIWVNTLAKCHKLHTLAYPLVTTITAAIKSKIPHTKHMPFILHLLTLLNRLADATNKFIPIVSIVFQLYEMLKKQEHKMKKGSDESLLKSDDMMIKLKLSSKDLHSVQTYKMLYRHIELVLIDHLGLVSLHPSFPEFTVPITNYLKKQLKNHHFEEVRTGVSSLLSVVDETVSAIKLKRADLKTVDGKLKLFVGDEKSIPMYQYRLNSLNRYQALNKEKVVGTINAFNM